MKRYEAGELTRNHIQLIVGIGQTRFFALIKVYRNSQGTFSLKYCRRSPTRRINPKAEKRIIQELRASQKLINNHNIPNIA
ncbi:MAG: hypothetical protein ABH952_04260 [Candidatus Omnitrophota bacterium]